MSFVALDLRRCAWLAAAVVFTVGVAGCRQRDEIARYTVRKPELVDPALHQASPAPTATVPQQTLGAIVMVDDTGWFFKLIGDPSVIQTQRERFVEFVQSITFTEGADAKPSWTLPEGWTELPGTGMRHASIQVVADGQTLDLSVIPLPKREETELEEYLLANVNRWRGEVGLPSIDAGDLSSESEKLEADDGREVMLVDITGVARPGGGMAGMMGGPFAGGASPPVASAPAAGSASPHADASSPITYEAPEAWSAGQINQFRKAAFVVSENEQRVEITVIDLPPGSGTLPQNINRWRDEVGLPEIAEGELAAETSKIETLGVQGDYVVLAGPESAEGRQTTLGVVAPAGGQVWFIKLRGDHELALREKPRFEAFVKSLKLKM
jgi:hypothetical protein